MLGVVSNRDIQTYRLDSDSSPAKLKQVVEIG